MRPRTVPAASTPLFRTLLLRRLKNLFPDCDVAMEDRENGVAFQLRNGAGQPMTSFVPVHRTHPDTLTKVGIYRAIRCWGGDLEGFPDGVPSVADYPAFKAEALTAFGSAPVSLAVLSAFVPKLRADQLCLTNAEGYEYGADCRWARMDATWYFGSAYDPALPWAEAVIDSTDFIAAVLSSVVDRDALRFSVWLTDEVGARPETSGR